MLSRREILASSAALVTATVMPPAIATAGAPAGRAGRVRIGCCWLGYQEYGSADGPLVLYFHGTPGSRLEAGLIAAEAQQARVRLVAVDRPGMGLSSPQPGRRILDWPGQVAQLAAALGHADSPFGILSLSGGAPYAAACALCIPGRLTHVAIVSGYAPQGAPGVQPGNQDKLLALLSRRQRLARVAFGLTARRLDRRPDKVVQQLAQSWSAADRQLVLGDPQLRCLLIANLDAATRCGPDGIVTDVRLLACYWGFPMSQIAGPAISIWQGGCDPIATPSMGRYMHAQLVGSELVFDPTAGHVTMLKRHANNILARAAGG